MKRVTTIAAVAILASCGMWGERRGASPGATESTWVQAEGEPSLEEMTRNAESQAGEVTGVTDHELRLRAYGREAGEARLEITTPDVPVFVEGARVGRDAIRQGEDVRVFYESGRGANPRVVAVEVLDEREATRLREPWPTQEEPPPAGEGVQPAR